MTTKTKVKATATIELDGFKLTVAGFYDEPEWETTMSFSSYITPDKVWVDDDVAIYDEDDLREFAWEQLIYILQKYNGFAISEEEEEVEVEDEDEE